MQRKKVSVIVSLVLACILLVSTTYAWYAGRMEVEIGTDSRVSIGVDMEGLEIALDGKTFTTNLQLSSNIKLCDISGDGINFLYPNILEADDLAPTKKSDFKIIDLTKDEYKNYLISFTATFRTKEKMDIYLSNDSYVKPKSYSYNSSTDIATAPTTLVRKSSGGGNFSTDCIAGCARVAIVEKNGTTESLKNLWVPNPYIQLNDENATTNPNTCDMNGKLESYKSQFSNTEYDSENPYGYVYIDGNNVKENVYTIEDYVTNKVTVGKQTKSGREVEETDPRYTALATSTSELIMVNNAKKLLSFEGSEEPVAKSLTIRIWFEGTDREANRLLNGGLVDFNLKFIGISKAAVSSELNTKLNSIVRTDVGNQGRLLYNGVDVLTSTESYQFSRNGYYWWDYDNNSSVFSGNYIRIKETKDTLPSEAVKVL